MPNVRRTFPGDDKSDSSDSNQNHYRGGGKQFGKYLRPQNDDEDDDDSEEEEDEEQSRPQIAYNNRGGGKQLRPSGGKYMRPPPQEGDDDEDDSDDDDEELEDVDDDEEDEPKPVRILERGGGKSLQRMPQAQANDEDDDEESSDDEEDAPVEPVRVMPRAGGKMLSQLQPPPATAESEEDEDDSDDEVEIVAAPAPKVYASPTGGKQLRRPEETPPTAPAISGISRAPAGGKQLRRPEPAEEDKPVPSGISRAPAGGKQLRRPEPEEDDNPMSRANRISQTPASVSESKVAQEIALPISRAPAGGKQLRLPEPEHGVDTNTIVRAPTGGKQLRPSREEPVTTQPTIISRDGGGGKRLPTPDSVVTKDAQQQPSTISRSPAGGKQLRRPEPEAPVAIKPNTTTMVQERETKNQSNAISRSPGGGKQLHRQVPKEEELSDDDEEVDEDNFDEEDDDEEEEYKAPTTRKGRPAASSRPKRRAAAKKAIVESEDDDFLEDDLSSDEDEVELDVNNTDALIKDDTDRKYLDSLPELEREAILGERFEKLKAEQDMKKAIREAKRKDAGKVDSSVAARKHKASPVKKPTTKAKTANDAALAKKLSGRRNSARDKDAKGAKSKKAAALAALKKERRIQQQRADDSDDTEADFGDDSDDDSDEGYEEEVKPWQKKKAAAEKKLAESRVDKHEESEDEHADTDEDAADRAKKQARANATSSSAQAVEADMSDFVKVTVPRRRLARWCNEPFFDGAVLECFVRLFIGENEGVKVYRLCEIVDVLTETTTYKFPVAKKGDKPISTNKQLKLRFGKSERAFQMSLVSDAPPDEKDVSVYKTAQRDTRMEVLSKRRATKLRRVQDELVNNYTYTTQDIENGLKQSKEQGKILGSMGAEQTKARIAVQAAQDAMRDAERRLTEVKREHIEYTGDKAREEELEKSITDAMNVVDAAKAVFDEKLKVEEKLESAVKERKSRLQDRQKDRNWARVNQRAREMNQKADRESNKPQEGVGAIAKKKEFDPYARRKVKPKILWEVGQDDEAQTISEEKKGDDVLKEDTVAGKEVETSTPSLVQEPGERAAALNESHQFAIDEEGLAQSSSAMLPSAGSSLRKSGRKRTRQGISLTDYLERKAAGTL